MGKVDAVELLVNQHCLGRFADADVDLVIPKSQL